MFLSYIDESGKASRRHKSKLFVQAAFIINEDQWQFVDNEVNNLKTNFFPNLKPEDIELHAYEITSQKRVYRTLGQAKSLSLLEDIFDLIGTIDCTLIGIVVDKTRCFAYVDIDLWSHRLLFERLCKYLEKANSKRINAGLPPEYGLLLIDSVQTVFDNAVRRKYKRFFSHGTYYLQNSYLIEDPLFVNSYYRNMSQLVDNVAYCLRRHFESRSLPSSQRTVIDDVVKEGLQSIKPRFDTCASGKIMGCGIKIFPPE